MEVLVWDLVRYAVPFAPENRLLPRSAIRFWLICEYASGCDCWFMFCLCMARSIFVFCCDCCCCCSWKLFIKLLLIQRSAPDIGVELSQKPEESWLLLAAEPKPLLLLPPTPKAARPEPPKKEFCCCCWRIICSSAAWRACSRSDSNRTFLISGARCLKAV